MRESVIGGGGPQRVHLVLLAAGESSRLGSPKQLIQFRGTPLIRHLAKVALDSRAEKVSIVVGAHADEISTEVNRLPVSIVRNEKWSEGVASSIHAALASLESAVTAMLVMLSDQPLVTAPVLNALIDTHKAHPARIVASSYAGTLGVPALFPRSFFPDLQALTGDHGAKSLLLKKSGSVIVIPFDDGAIDIDTLSDLHKLA